MATGAAAGVLADKILSVVPGLSGLKQTNPALYMALMGAAVAAVVDGDQEDQRDLTQIAGGFHQGITPPGQVV
jgi:hypothetical protein